MKSSGQQTADGVVMASDGRFFGITITPDGSNNVTVTVYDSASAASGTKITPDIVVAGNGGTQEWSPPIEPVDCIEGIYVDITTDGTVKYNVYYEEGR